MPIPPIPLYSNTMFGGCGQQNVWSPSEQVQQQSLQAQVSVMSDEDKVQLLQALGIVSTYTPTALTEVIDALPTADKAKVFVDTGCGAITEGTLGTKLVVSGEVAESALTVACPEGAAIGLGLLVGADILGQKPNVVTLTVDSETCGDQGGIGQEIEMNVYAPDASANSVLQAVMTKLDALLRCCPPCKAGNTILANLTGAGFFAPVPPIGQEIAEIQFLSFTAKYPIDAEYGAPGLYKLGKYAWLRADGTTDDIHFLNTEKQGLVPPPDNCVGLQYALTPGVVILIQYNWRPHWGLIASP